MEKERDYDEKKIKKKSEGGMPGHGVYVVVLRL